MKTYTSKGYVLGHRCDRGHSGNRRYVRDGSHAECQGCGAFVGIGGMEFPSRSEALRADRSFHATWPEDTSAAVLAAVGSEHSPTRHRPELHPECVEGIHVQRGDGQHCTRCGLPLSSASALIQYDRERHGEVVTPQIETETV